MLQNKEQEKIEKGLSLCVKGVSEWYKSVSPKVHHTLTQAQYNSRITPINSQYRIKINDCKQKFPKRKPHSKSQHPTDNQLMNKPSFILEVLSGLDDRDFQLRRQNQALERQNQAILKRLERLERQVKRSKYSRNLKKERSSSSS